jgi:Na+-driven multidrug efflux pump
LYILTASGITNVVLNVVFVAVFRMDVAGVAISTVISQFVSVSATVGILLKTNSGIKLYPGKLRLYGKELKQILLIGIPTGI